MNPSAITFTKNAQERLASMTSDAHACLLNYLDNPIFMNAIAAGEPFQWWASTNNISSWMDITCDKNTKIDIEFFELATNGNGNGNAKVMPPNNVKMLTSSTPLHSNGFASADFRRTRATLGNLAFAAFGAGRRGDLILFQRMIDALAKHIPWVDQINSLAQRLHGSAAGPHFLNQAMNQMALLAKTLDASNVHNMASPCTTAQALLAVHATQHASTRQVHNEFEPGLYALDVPGQAPMFMFVQPRQIGTADVSFTALAHVWLDHTATPVFVNTLYASPDTHFADMPNHPDSEMAAVQWIPEGPSTHGVPDTLTDWAQLMQQGFNQKTRQLCNQLACATPRLLDQEESFFVVQQWANAEPATDTLWLNTRSKESRSSLICKITDEINEHPGIFIWANYARKVWAEQHPAEHAMLDSLLPEMSRLVIIEQWRQQMNTVNIKEAFESFPLNNLITVSP